MFIWMPSIHGSQKILWFKRLLIKYPQEDAIVVHIQDNIRVESSTTNLLQSYELCIICSLVWGLLGNYHEKSCNKVEDQRLFADYSKSFTVLWFWCVRQYEMKTLPLYYIIFKLDVWNCCSIFSPQLSQHVVFVKVFHRVKSWSLLMSLILWLLLYLGLLVFFISQGRLHSKRDHGPSLERWRGKKLEYIWFKQQS